MRIIDEERDRELRKLLQRAYARLPGAWETARKERGRPPSGVFAFFDARTTGGQVLAESLVERGTFGGAERDAIAMATDERPGSAGVIVGVAAFIDCELFAALIATMVDVEALEEVREWLAAPVPPDIVRIGVVARGKYKLIHQRVLALPDDFSPTPS